MARALQTATKFLPHPYSNHARAWEYAFKYRAIAENYRFEKMATHHLPHLMDLTKVAFQDGSTTLGTGVTFDECYTAYEYLFKYAIAANALTNFSDIVYDNKTNQPAAFRMVDPVYRDPSKAPFPIPKEPPLNEKEELLLGYIDNIQSNMWKQFPEEEVVFKPSLMFIHPAHRKNGLFKVYCEYDFDFSKAIKKTGAKYYMSLTTAHATKSWCKMLGETLFYTSPPTVKNVRGETIPLPDGEILVFAKDMRTNYSVNVKPCWEKMRACGMMPKPDFIVFSIIAAFLRLEWSLWLDIFNRLANSSRMTTQRLHATTWKYAFKYRSVAENYRFEKIAPHHLPQLMDLSRGFFEDESVTMATGSTIDNCRKGMEYVFAYCLAAQRVCNLNEICYENKTNKPIGFRLANPYYRDPKMAPFSVPEPTLSKQEITLFTPLDETFDQIWNCFPNEDVILKGEVIYIDRAHRRASGLMQVWIDYGFHFPTQMKQTGANIYALPCTAHQTKGWFAKQGYTTSYASPPYVTNAEGKQVPLPQGSIHLCTLDMNTATALNVVPCWEKMKKLGMMP